MRESPDTKIRIPAIAILGLVGDPRAVDVFIKGYRDESLQQSVLAAMRDMGAMIGPLLYSRCVSADEEERCIIMHIAGELDLAESRKIAAAGMDDPSATVRALAAEAVGKSGMTELIPALVKLLTDMNAEVRRRATGALVRLTDVARENVAASAQLLAEADSADCRLQAVKLFGALRDVAHLNFLGKDEDAQVRREAITTLGDIRLPDSAGRIAMALTDEEADVRVAAATALGWSGFADETHSLHLALWISLHGCRWRLLKVSAGVRTLRHSRQSPVLLSRLQGCCRLLPCRLSCRLIRSGLHCSCRKQQLIRTKRWQVLPPIFLMLLKKGSDAIFT